MTVQQFGFGTGILVTRRTDITNPTPTMFGVLQEVDLTFDRSLKELYGQNQYPVAVAASGTKITGSAKTGQIRVANMSDTFFGATPSVGNIGVPALPGETATIPATPFQVTVANGAAFVEDLGVYKQSDYTQFTRVASAPAVGQYAVNEATGVYTFNSADTTIPVYIMYTYNIAGSGTKFTITNPLMGNQPTFEMWFQEKFQNQTLTIRLLSCISGKLAWPFKNQDFLINQMDFQAFADPITQNIGFIYGSN
jgi:hypothetical protein